MKRIMVIPVGEQIKPLLYGFRFFSEIDEVILLYSSDTEKECKKIEKIIEESNLALKITRIECDPKNLTSIIYNLKKYLVLEGRIKDEIIFNITGGTKIMSLGCYIFSLIFGGGCFYIFKEKNGKMSFQKVPVLKTQSLEKIVSSKVKQKIIDYLFEKKKAALREIKELFNLKPSTVLYYLKELIKEGIVEKNEKKYSLTKFGELVKILTA